MNADEVMDRLAALADEDIRRSKQRVAIEPDQSLGISKGDLRDLAGEIGTDHDLALELWETGVHEARVIASIIADPERVDGELMDEFAAGFDSWALCDQCCTDLFRHTDHADAKAREWLDREEEFVKRAGFVLIAVLANHSERHDDGDFETYLDLLRERVDDDRRYVKKGASWAIRAIGKRNGDLRESAIETARELRERDSKPARWIGRDVLDDLDAAT